MVPELSLDDAALRRDIRRVVGLLGDALVRLEGQEVLDLVERVRSGSREDRTATAALLDGLDVVDATRLVRAFVAYFHLANITEQVHRSRAVRAARVEGGWMARATLAIQKAGFTRDELEELVRRVSVRPVFTAHPTEAARRTTLTKLRAVAALLWKSQAGPRRADRRLAEAIELLWQTDDLRVAQPDPLDEARNAVYYFDELPATSCPTCSTNWQRRWSGPASGSSRRRPPLTFGSWIGGDRDGNPNVTADVTLEVLRLQTRPRHPRRLRLSSTVCARTCRQSNRLTGVSAELTRSLAGRPGRPARGRGAATCGSTPRSRTGSRAPAYARS